MIAPFVEAFLGALLTIVASIAGRLLISLGFGVVTVSGFNFGLGWLKDTILEKFTGLESLGAGIGSDVLQLLSACGVGIALSIVFGAWAMRLTMDGLSIGGVLSRMVQTGWNG